MKKFVLYNTLAMYNERNTLKVFNHLWESESFSQWEYSERYFRGWYCFVDSKDYSNIKYWYIWYDENKYIKWDKMFNIWLEIERNNYLERDELIKIHKKGFTSWYDGSVSWWEYKTPVYSFDTAWEVFRKLSPVKEIFNEEHFGNNCWWHIHLSKKDTDNRELFNDIKYYRNLLVAIYPERANSTYCSSFNENTKYSIMQVHNAYNTVEVRIFPAHAWYIEVKNRIKFCEYMMKNPATTFAELIDKLRTRELQILIKKLTKWKFKNIKISEETEKIILE